MENNKTAIVYAILAAFCYGTSATAAKVLLLEVPPVLMAALLYLGAGVGMAAIGLLRGRKMSEASLTKKELPYIIGMIVLDIAAPIFLMLGLSAAMPATVALMNNFEIVATAMIALIVFREAVGKRMWAAIFLITAASVILSVEDFGHLSVSPGAVLVLLASICWGLENNCTRMLSLKDPLQIVVIKGFASGLGSLIIAIVLSQASARFIYILLSLLLGFVAYGLSIYFYIFAQRQLGATRTSAYYAFAPFIGVVLSFIIFRQELTVSFWSALFIMALGAYFAASEHHSHRHTHESLEHEHRHSHDDAHHDHMHTPPVTSEHSHPHVHTPIAHTHKHTPDPHHLHRH